MISWSSVPLTPAAKPLFQFPRSLTGRSFLLDQTYSLSQKNRNTPEFKVEKEPANLQPKWSAGSFWSTNTKTDHLYWLLPTPNQT